MDGDIYENWMDSHGSPQHLQHQQQTQGLQANGLQMMRMETQPPFVMFIPPKLQVPINKKGFSEGQTFEFGLGSILVHKLGSLAEGFKNPMTQISTPKSMDELSTKVMQMDKVTELFQTMTIVNLNMGNLNLEVNVLKNRLAIKEKEKVLLQVELDKERDFQKEYNQNI